MKNKAILLVCIFVFSACNVSNTQAFATNFPSLPVPTPFITFTPSPIPAATLSPEPRRTPTFPPYTGEPFSIVFTRNRNIWIAEIGQETVERQLTFEPEPMRVISFDVSPDQTRIAYIPYQLEPLNSLVKLVEIATGETRVILGKDDPFSETRVIWLDNTKIAYKNQDSLASSFVKQRVNNITTFIVYDVDREAQVQVTRYHYLLPSPNQQIWLGCYYGAEGCGHYFIQYAGSSTRYNLERGMELGWFLGWSPDSQYLLFNTVTSPDVCRSQLILIHVKTLEAKLITPNDQNVWDASLSPSGNLLFYKQSEIADLGLCKSGKLDYWLMDLKNQAVQEILVEFKKDVWEFNWTPDGKRLVFFHDGYNGREHQLWSMNVDGSDLKPILADVEDFIILSDAPLLK